MPQQFIGVKAVILDGNKILLIKRSNKYDDFSGAWDIPGGRINFGEEPVSGLRREVKEETGLDLKEILRPLDARTVFNDGERQIVRITYLCKTADREIKLSDEHTEMQWFDINDLNVEFKDKEMGLVLEQLKKELE